MDRLNWDNLRRMAEAQERIASVLERQQPGRFIQTIATIAAIATALGILTVIDIFVKWIGG
jgi:hypothetical protein